MVDGMTPVSTQRDIGSLQSDVQAIKQDLRCLQADVREVRDFMRGAQSNWKLIMALCTISAAVGTVIAKLISYLALTLK